MRNNQGYDLITNLICLNARRRGCWLGWVKTRKDLNMKGAVRFDRFGKCDFRGGFNRHPI